MILTSKWLKEVMQSPLLVQLYSLIEEYVCEVMYYMYKSMIIVYSRSKCDWGMVVAATVCVKEVCGKIHAVCT